METIMMKRKKRKNNDITTIMETAKIPLESPHAVW
jgi:hypothetical protein